MTIRAVAVGHTVRVTAPLRGSRRYVRYFCANQISSTGNAMATGAVAYTVLTTGGGAAGIAMVFLGQMLTTGLMLPIGGTLADRLPRVRVIVVVQLVVGLIVAVQSALIFAGQARAWNLALIAAAVNIAAAFSRPAQTGLVTALVPAEQLPEANALEKARPLCRDHDRSLLRRSPGGSGRSRRRCGL